MVMKETKQTRRVFARRMARGISQLELKVAGGGLLGGTPTPQQNSEEPESAGGGTGGGDVGPTQYITRHTSWGINHVHANCIIDGDAGT